MAQCHGLYSFIKTEQIMKLNLSDKLQYKVRTSNGKEGKVKDFLFDEEQWYIRYLDVDMGGFFTDRRILIPISKVEKGNWIDECFQLDIHSKELKKMPTLSDKQTVSRAYEAKLAKHFKTEEYWGRRYVPSMAPPTMGVPQHVFQPTQNRRMSGRVIKEDDIETNLRSFKEISGYEVFAKNGKVGHVEDLLVESKNMQIISLVVQAKFALDYSKEIIVANTFITEISYVERGLSLSLSKGEVLDSPEFDLNQGVNEKEVIKKFDYTGKPIKS